MRLTRAALAAVSLVAVAVLGTGLLPTQQAAAEATERTFRRLTPWAPPEWHPDSATLTVLPAMDGDAEARLPGLGARAAFVYDLDAQKVLYDRAADDVRPVASLTKLVSSLAMASEQPDLDRVVCVDARLYPTRSGARSKLSTGECYTGWDLLGAALVASDNRAAYGMYVLSGLDYDPFLERMHEVSYDLGMARSTWGDPSGLEDDNLSTARDMTRAVVAVAAHPTLSVAATAPRWVMAPLNGRSVRTLFTTDKLAGRPDIEVLAAKTGYTDTAGYCFSAVVRTEEGRTIAMTLLGDPRSKDRWRDAQRIVDWVSR